MGGVVGLLVLAAGATASPAHTLKMFEARSAAESAAFEFQMRRDLDSSTVGRCKRRSRLRVFCVGKAMGESSTKARACALGIRVRSVYRTYYWDEVAAVVKRRCDSEAKLRLSYDAALVAIQIQADRFAGQATAISSLRREDDLTFTGTADWNRVRVPPNEFLPTESCSVRLVATLSAAGLSVSNDGFFCY